MERRRALKDAKAGSSKLSSRRAKEVEGQKDRRARQFMARRGPLSEVQAEPEMTKSEKEKARMEKLRKWQKERDERKRKERLERAKNKPFQFGTVKPLFSEQPDTFYSKPSKHSSKAASSSKPAATSTKPVAKVVPMVSTQVTSTSTRQNPATRSRNTKSTVSNQRASQDKAQSRPIRTSSRAKTKSKPTSRVKCLTSEMSSPPKETSHTSSPPARAPSPPPSPSPPPVSSPPASVTPLVTRSRTRTPSKTNPSKSRSKTPKHTVNESAWIPGATVDTPGVTALAEKFDEVFGKTCSPFHFTGGPTDSTAQSFEFTFKKQPKSPSSLTRAMAATLTADSLDEMTEEEEDPVPSKPNQLDDSLDSSQPTKQKGLVDNEENMVTEDDVGSKDEKMDSDGGVETDEKPKEETDGEALNSASCNVDVTQFRQLYTDVVEEFNQLSEQWEHKVEQMEGNETAPNDQVLDQIRTTVCQARLLIRSKLKQYIGLVDKAEDKSASRITSEDLQGFWDMVYYQVVDIRNKFSQLVDMEQNGWQLPQSPSPKQALPRRSKRKAAAIAHSKVTACVTPKTPNKKLQAAREKREAERKRLRQLKMAAMKKAKAAMLAEDATATDTQDEAPVETTASHTSPSPSTSSSTRKKCPSTGRRRRSTRKSLPALIDFTSPSPSPARIKGRTTPAKKRGKCVSE